MKLFATRSSWLALLAWLALSFAAAGVGGLAAADAQEFYSLLQQPSWAPPGKAFGPVWTALYVMMAVAAWLVWLQRAKPHARKGLIFFVLQLVANALWCWLFFAWKMGGLAFLDVLILWALLSCTVYHFAFVSRWAAALMLPCWGWVTFAVALNLVVWQLNPQNL
ncbi:TspO/MBR family protein [Gilvimarinus sp. DA14]|uniref:TspO/MBR family protein n=1 Tax=Gilvimarinus sp. DA14 TaxID=2956798 RepID=UPI0020B67AAF|nr:TspO/MBR family protein [Gilvimarinus sp. DA14]UTF58596.1 tryptophan-rich sensory protein [Gilvimarinus sp. DA14]